jgi:RyR domain
VETYTDEEVARVCHGAACALQAVQEDPCPALPWDTLPPEARAVVISGVRMARCGSDARGLHDHWVRRMTVEGWIFGPVKDAVQRTHPLLVSWARLPEAQKAKDYLFRMVVIAMTPGLQNQVTSGVV